MESVITKTHPFASLAATTGLASSRRRSRSRLSGATHELRMKTKKEISEEGTQVDASAARMIE